MTIPDTEKLYTIKEAAELLNVSEGTVRNEIKRGRLKVIRMGTKDKAVRVPGWAIQDFLQLLANEPQKRCA